MSDVVVRLQGVEKTFRAYHAMSVKESMLRMLRGQTLVERRAVLRGVDFEVRRGERFGLVGRNGAGKSTLFRLMSGIMVPDRGVVELTGRIAPLIEVTAGFVADMTGEENLRLNAALLGLSRAQIAARRDAIVAFAGVEEFMATPVRYYSSGMMARLGFSIATHVDADVLLVDEVLAVGDVEFQARCLRRLEELSANGATIVLVSHDVRTVASFCGRAAWLEEGRVRLLGRAPDVVGAFEETLRAEAVAA